MACLRQDRLKGRLIVPDNFKSGYFNRLQKAKSKFVNMVLTKKVRW